MAKLRIVKVESEENFLVCIKCSLWASERARFGQWEPGDYLAFLAKDGLAGLAEVIGEGFKSEATVCDIEVFPNRVPIRFIYVLYRQDRVPLQGKISAALTADKGPRYGYVIRNQTPLPEPVSQLVMAEIRSRPDGLADTIARLEQLMAEAVQEAAAGTDESPAVGSKTEQLLSLVEGGGRFAIGQEYRRRDLQAAFGGQTQGGMSTPSRYPIILLFTPESGANYGYQDHRRDGIFLYAREGQRGEMAFVRGNKAILNHSQDHKDLHLFRQVSKGCVSYVGQMVCTGYQLITGADVDRHLRQVLVFELTPLSALEPFLDESSSQSEEQTRGGLWAKSLGELRQLAGDATSKGSTAQERLSVVRTRSQAVRVYVLKRANGVCEGCSSPAPFVTRAGLPYLEPHHIRRLSDGGPDDVSHVAGICPNCHRRAHLGSDASEYNSHLANVVAKREGHQPFALSRL